MNTEQQFEKMFRQEFGTLAKNTIFYNDLGEYEVFDRYKIIPTKSKYSVMCSATEVGIFASTKTALSWCIADKYAKYNLAREILELDCKLASLTADITARAQVADSSKRPEFRETIATKLESKILIKKMVEKRLTNCINSAKYYQQKGFNDEIIRTSRQPNKERR